MAFGSVSLVNVDPANNLEPHVDVDWTNPLVVGQNMFSSNLDAQGGLLWTESNIVWVHDAADAAKKQLFGGGTRELQTEGEKIPTNEVILNGPVCQATATLYWGIHQSAKPVLYKIDTISNEAEAILIGSGDANPGDEGKFGADIGQDEKKATVSNPEGPIVSILGPNGPQIFFYDRTELRMVDLNSKMVKKMSSNTPNAIIHHPSLHVPSQAHHAFFHDCYHQRNPSGTDNGLHINNTRIAWVTNTSSSSTHLLDLDSGNSVLLSDFRLHPLFAASSNLALAVEIVDRPAPDVLKDAWLVFVDWSLPSDLESRPDILKDQEARYALPPNRIQRVSQIAGDFSEKSRFWLDPESNQLHVSTSVGAHTRYPNACNISMTTVNGCKHVIFPKSASTGCFFAPNLLALSLPGCPLPYDVEISTGHKATWKLHSELLRHHQALKGKEKVAKLSKIIQHSQLPSASIAAFLSFLHFSDPIDINGLDIDAAAEDGKQLAQKIEDAFMRICHCVQLCNQVGMADSYKNHLFWILQTHILTKISNAAFAQRMLTLWIVEQDPAPESVATYTKDSSLMTLLAARYRHFVPESELENALEKFEFPKGISPQKTAVLVSALTNFLSPTSSLKLDMPVLSPSAPSMRCQPLRWNPTLPVSAPRTPPKSKHTFIFTIEGLDTGGIECDSLVMYPQWKWFENLCKVDCEESKSRHVVMPAQFTPQLLLTLLSAAFGTYQPGTLDKRLTSGKLSSADISVLYRFMDQLFLPQCPSFSTLAEECYNILHSAINDLNCLPKLRELWDAGMNLSYRLFADTLKMVEANSDKISLKDLKDLPLRLKTIIIIFGDEKTHTKGQSFVNLATAIDGSVEHILYKK